jgi:hypothetical protein
MAALGRFNGEHTMPDFALFDSLLVLFWVLVFLTAVYVIGDSFITAWPHIKRLARQKDQAGQIVVTWKSGRER